MEIVNNLREVLETCISEGSSVEISPSSLGKQSFVVLTNDLVREAFFGLSQHLRDKVVRGDFKGIFAEFELENDKKILIKYV